MRLERGKTCNARRSWFTGLSTTWRRNIPPRNQEKRLLKRCRGAGNCTGRGCAAIEAEGSVEGVRITEIQGIWSISATIEAANWDATEMSRSACWFQLVVLAPHRWRKRGNHRGTVRR